ncbi:MULTISPECIES: M15 family metallopeptidase [Rahnella]|uniref:M15 family metallopeptidase n=1 Tax=Rahnella laticis TaxID=2787622 RepID=A0ABS0E4F7_9GAMM|nr:MULTISPECIES: M15 family metallopeptidase [Rahnella]MBF7979978.1 M15 family metallopeptidase [Rahnella laticis]MBF8000068.1 M15 family metallopeptidase [Rahnella sp. LAC-M12]
MISHEMLTGRSDAHLVTLGEGPHRLQKAAAGAFAEMQKAAAQAGFNLQPASTFRDFSRQRAIWNGKFRGERPVLDKNSQPVDISTLSAAERCELILRWSALPGASRHHWGSDLDVYDPSLLPEGRTLQLEPWEYEENGYFHRLNLWMSAHMEAFGFYRPFAQDRGGVAVEPWHLSYRPLAQQCESQLTPEVLISAWQGQDIAGSDWVISEIATIFPRFIALNPT